MPTIYNPFLPEIRSDPYPIYREIRISDPVQFNPHAGLWNVTRYADCMSVLRDRKFSSNLAQSLRRRRNELPTSMLSADPPEHTRLRAPVSNQFNRTRMQRIRESVTIVAAALLRETAHHREADLLADFARPLVTQTFAEILGVPPKDASGLSALIADASLSLDPLAPPDRQNRADAASDTLSSYFRELIFERRRSPGDDVLSALVNMAAEKVRLSDHEILSACNLLLIGGYDPAVHLIGNGMLALMKHPDELRRIQGNLSLMPSAVEEFLRFDSPIQLAARVALEDAEIGRRTVQRGQAVIVLIGAANRDPAVFTNPDCLDIERAPNPHITFGSGVHLCLGAQLARVIGQVAMQSLLLAFPHIRLVGDEPQWCDALIPRGLQTLLVTLS